MKKQLVRSKFSTLIAIGIALCIIPTLFFGCEIPLTTPPADAPAVAGYGNVTINFAGGAARTVFPAQVFDNYSYRFTKSGGSAQTMTPGPDSKFTLETGQWTVEVKAYAGTVDETNLAATGTAQFTVNHNAETQVTVYLTGITENGSGTFKYRIQYPITAAVTDITMEKLSESDSGLTVDLSASPVLESGAMMIAKTVNAVSAGFYLVSVRLAIGDTVAGRNEVVHIYNNLTSEFGTETEPIVFTVADFAHPGAPAAPARPTATVAPEQFTVTWTTVPNATAYEVWYGTANYSEDVNTTKFGDDVTTGTSAVITGLTNSTTYYVWVKAKNGVGTSAFSESRNGTPSSSNIMPSTPATPTISAGDRQLTVSWTPLSYAVAYEVWYGTLNDSAAATQFGGDITTGTFAVITGLDNGTTYYVWIKAKRKSDGLTTRFNTTAASGIPTAGPVVPAAPTVTQIGNQLRLAVSWAPVGGATSYKVVYNTANNTTSGAKEIDTISGTAGTITGAKEISETLDNRVYYVFVKAINDLGESAYGPAGIGIFPPPTAPTVTPYTAEGVYAAWTVVPGANAYEVYYNTTDTTEDATKWSANPTTAGVAITGLTAGTRYYVWVKARFNTGPIISGFSPSGSGTVPVQLEDPTVAPVVTPGVRQLALSWTPVTGATSYEVWYGTSSDSNNAVKFGDTPFTTAAITKLADAVNYYVWIKAKNVVGTTGFSPSASGTTQTPSDISVDRGTVTVKDSGGAVVTGITLFKSGSGATPQTITLSVDGTFTNGQWYVDGISAGGSATLTLDADTYTATVHSVSFAGWRNGVYVSSTPIPFTAYEF
jgi:hypothetical protein